MAVGGIKAVELGAVGVVERLDALVVKAVEVLLPQSEQVDGGAQGGVELTVARPALVVLVARGPVAVQALGDDAAEYIQVCLLYTSDAADE